MTIHTQLSLSELEALVFNADGRKFLYAHSPECGSCAAMGPLVSSLHAELENELVFVQVNVLERPEVWEAFEMASIPACFVIESGEVIAEGVGVLTIDQMRDLARTIPA